MLFGGMPATLVFFLLVGVIHAGLHHRVHKKADSVVGTLHGGISDLESIIDSISVSAKKPQKPHSLSHVKNLEMNIDELISHIPGNLHPEVALNGLDADIRSVLLAAVNNEHNNQATIITEITNALTESTLDTYAFETYLISSKMGLGLKKMKTEKGEPDDEAVRHYVGELYSKIKKQPDCTCPSGVDHLKCLSHIDNPDLLSALIAAPEDDVLLKDFCEALRSNGIDTLAHKVMSNTDPNQVCILNIAKNQQSDSRACTLFGIPLSLAKDTEGPPVVEIFGYKFPGHLELSSGSIVGMALTGIRDEKSAIGEELLRDFARSVKDRLQQSLLNADETCFLGDLISNQLPSTTPEGFGLSIKVLPGGHFDIKMSFTWPISASYFEQNFFGGVNKWTATALDTEALKPDTHVGSVTCEIVSSSSALEKANIRLHVRMDQGVATTSLMQIKSMVIDIKKPDTLGRETDFVTGHVDVRVGVCPEMPQDSKISTSFDQRIPIHMMFTNHECRLRFFKDLVDPETKVGKYASNQDIQQQLCTPALARDGHHICFSVRSIELNPHYRDRASVCTLTTRNVIFQPATDWLFEDPLEGNLVVRGDSKPERPEVWFEPMAKHLQQRDIARLKIAFSLQGSGHGIRFVCESECVGGEFKLAADFKAIRQSRDEFLLPSVPSFFRDFSEMLIAPFSTPLAAGNLRLAAINFCQEKLGLTIESAQICGSGTDASQRCMFDGGPAIRSLGTSPKLHDFGLLIPSLKITYDEVKKGVRETQVTLPITIALPGNTNDLLGLGLADPDFEKPDVFLTMPESDEDLNDKDVKKMIEENGFRIDMIASQDRETGKVKLVGKMMSLPLKKETILEYIRPNIIPEIAIPDIVLLDEGGYYSFQMKTEIPILCPPSHDDAICTLKLPDLWLLRQLFTKLGFPFGAVSVPPAPPSFGNVPPLKDSISNLYGSTPRDEMMDLQQSAYEAVNGLVTAIKAATERAEKDLADLNKAFAEKGEALVREVGAHSLTPDKGEYAQMCEIPQGQEEPQCSGSFTCSSEVCDLARDDAKKKLRLFAAKAIGLAADLNAIQVIKLDSWFNQAPVVSFTFLVSRITLPHRMKKYFSPTQVPYSFPRNIEIDARLNQDGNIWMWARPLAGVKTDGPDSFRTLFLPSGEDKADGIRGMILRGMMIGYFTTVETEKSAYFSVGVDMDMDYFERKTNILEMMLQKRFIDTECEAFFDVPEEKLPHPSSLSTTVRLENALFFVNKGQPIPLFADRAGISVFTPFGSEINVHVRSRFQYQDFRWDDSQAVLVTPSFMRLPKWMGGYCFEPTNKWPEMCPVEEDILYESNSVQEISTEFYTMRKYVDGAKAGKFDPLDLQLIFKGMEIVPSSPQPLSLLLLEDMDTTHSFTTLSALMSPPADQPFSQMPTYPGTTERAFASWNVAPMPDKLGSSRSYLSWLIDALKKDGLPSADDADFERIVQDLHRSIKPAKDVRFTLNHTTTAATRSQAAVKPQQKPQIHHKPPPQSTNAKAVHAVPHHKFKHTHTDHLSSFLELESQSMLTEGGVESAGLILLAFRKMMGLGSLNFGIKGIGAIKLADLMTGPSKIHHIVELAANIGGEIMDCQSEIKDQVFCFTAVSSSQLGPASKEKENMYVPKELSSVVQLPVRGVCTQPRMMKPHKRRTLFRTAMDGNAVFLGAPADATLTATDNSVVLMAIFTEKTATNDAQRRGCTVSQGQIYDFATCNCLNKFTQELDVNCPLTSVYIQLTRVDVTMSTDASFKQKQWKLDATVRNVPSHLLETFMSKIGLPKAKQQKVTEIVRHRPIARVRIGDILLSDLENSPGRVVVEICWEEGSRCIRGQSWSSLFVNPTPEAWEDHGTSKDDTLASADPKRVEKYALKVTALTKG